ncbi:ChrR family anti-sigma-E factor [Oryzicola mucosus]|uniref:Cupin domain-containing protein n=1 Tax=Oryzicola mucosus TaxID=2767425 RepID=A0A8J6U1X1_9HYPH|nr:ChrR family anti-sigma-E factor [Oryzicola mucosus]MBD0415018.1 cupin domain-containing protein [Oryzicola mucosus]
MSERVDINELEDLLVGYAAGTLPIPAHVLVAAHLEMNPERQRFVDAIETLSGDALSDQAPIDLSDGDARLRTIIGQPPLPSPPPLDDPVFPKALRAFAGFSSNEIPWRTKLPGLKEYSFGDIDGCETALLWARAGRALPDHTHEGRELTLVLSGSFSDKRGCFERGDISIADEMLDHRPVAGKDGPCLCLSVIEGKLRLTGSLFRKLGDIIGT